MPVARPSDTRSGGAAGTEFRHTHLHFSCVVARAEQGLHDFIERGRPEIYNVAINSYDGYVDFYRNLQKDDRGAISLDFAARNEKLGTTNETVRVKCLRFEHILEECGTPHYPKVDIEGADTICLQATREVLNR